MAEWLSCISRRRLSAGDNSTGHIGTRHTDPGPGPLGPDRHNIERNDRNAKDIIPDWTDNVRNGCHLWVPCDSHDNCHFPQYRCRTKSGASRIRCVACRLVVHRTCLEIVEQDDINCSSTFREPHSNQIGNSTNQITSCRHHWILRKRQDGRCTNCSKKFEKERFFNRTDSKKPDYLAISCSWCKRSFHYNDQCFNVEEKLQENCDLGDHAKLIVPPYWIVKTRRSTRPYKKRKPSEKGRSGSIRKSFVVNPKFDYESKTPLLVFINPKSGGNQGHKVLSELQYLLNPRQVFDLSQGGPKPALELYRSVPNLRVLCAGGDGTCGWVMSAIDEVGFTRSPPVCILPLGTGNDLSRSLDWGRGYEDTSLSKILHQIEHAKIQPLDRWNIEVDEGDIKLPLNVINNYISMGVDAEACYKFHTEREANPEKFSSRLGNKVLYGKYGILQFLKFNGASRELYKHVRIVCDGKDETKKLHDLHAVSLSNSLPTCTYRTVRVSGWLNVLN